jgi:hypothetical protein
MIRSVYNIGKAEVGGICMIKNRSVSIWVDVYFELLLERRTEWHVQMVCMENMKCVL